MRNSILLVAGVLCLIGVAVVPRVVVIKLLLPETFSSTARIVSAATDSTAIATEIELIRSRAVILPVITNLDLARKYAEKSNENAPYSADLAYAMLSAQLAVKPAKGTRVIEISVSSEDKTEAAAIANEVALVYIKSPIAARGADSTAVAHVIDEAKPAFRALGPSLGSSIATGIGLGALLTVLGIFLVWKSCRGRTRPTDGKQPIELPPILVE